MSWFPLLTRSAHRIGLEDYLTQEAALVQGTVLDVGSKDRRYDRLFSGEVTACDITPNPAKNVIEADIHKLPFKAETFDNCACFEVLEYTYDPKLALDELFRITKPKGTILISIPFLTYFHDDMIRVTENWLTAQLKDKAETITILPIGSAYTVIVDVLRRKALEHPSKLFRLSISYPLLWILGLFLPRPGRAAQDRRYCTGYFVVAKKKGSV